MSFRGRDSSDGGGKMDEPRRYGSGLDDKSMDDSDDRRFDSGRGRRPPFGRGRRLSPPGRDRPRDFGYGRDEPPIRDRSPMRGPDDRFSDRYKKDDGPYSKREEGRKDMGRPFYGDDPHRDRYMEGGRSRLEGPSAGYNSRFDAPDQFKARSMNYPSAPPPPPTKGYFNEGFPKPNECEIIAVNKQQRAYAESVEARIKDLGILVDVLFLKDEALLTQTIDDIARRGSLYAMVISPQNETHGSVTVNILHGTPQEHRNMPLDDALKLVARNFHEHIRLQREKMERERAERGPYIGTVTADREMQVLLRMLADGRWISAIEIDAVIRYLSERRDRMQGVPGEDRGIGRMPPIPPSDIKRDIPPFKPHDIDVAQKEQDLQNRIMNIMNQGAPTQPIGSSPSSDLSSSTGVTPRMGSNINSLRPQPGMGPNIPGLKSTPPIRSTEEAISEGLQSSAGRGNTASQPIFTSTTAGDKTSNDNSSTPTYINFNNPSVQKALDNLIQSGPSLLKNISLSGTNLSTPPPALPENASKPPIGGQGPLIPPPNDPMGMQRGGMGPPRGPGSMADMPGSGQARGRGSLDMGPPRGGGNLDMGPPRSGGNLDMGPPRGGGNLDMGPPRGAGNLDMGPHRGNPNIGGPGPQRGPGSDMMGMGQGPQRGGFGGMSDMGGMNSNRGYENTGMDSGIDQQRMSDMGRMGGPHLGMGPGSGFPGQNQFGKYQGPGQQGGFPGSYNNSSNLGNMQRQNYGGGQGMGGMGGTPRRY
ncbi:nuclear receptor coactivator 5-like isoform X2 [Argiope bruennichi]|uniref:nuclear receptor coactivator 5-like isoform X2 n=1 Tax=Argiope bruennichi TaxID=94029 RepID=UPI002493FD46|nr:nuclear receptor coactivator 5-like isoform X2 [Argiope bruennichi]